MHKVTYLFFCIGFTLGMVFSVLVFRATPSVRAAVGTVTIDQSVGGTVTLGTVDFQKIQDSANTSYFLDPAATGDSLVLAGTATASGNLTVGNSSAIRAAFGPLSLQYKSGIHAWTTGVTLQDTTGNVGIGTTAPASKLTVGGTVESTSGGFKFPDATTQTSAATGMTSGMIAFFAAACPSGWTEYTAARGMYIVGNPLSGTLATAVGTALTNLENRAVGQHLHSVDPASTGVSISDPGHNHQQKSGPANGNGVSEGIQSYTVQYGSGGSRRTDLLDSATTGISASVDIAAFNSANAGTVAGTNAPYIQLTACQKN